MQSSPISLLAGPTGRMDVAPRQSMHPSPLLLALAALLPLSSQDLDDEIERERAENPALERLDATTCPICDGEFGRPCPRCRPSSFVLGQRGPSATAMPTDVAAESTPEDSLLAEVRLVLRKEGDAGVAEFVVGSLDEHGFLPGGAAEVACRLGVAASRVDRVMRAIRTVGPPGLGARDAQECLLLQLDRLASDRKAKGDAADSGDVSLARAIVESHLEALARGRFASIARALRVTPDAVGEAREFIRSRLSPYPSSGFAGGEPATPVLPDVVVRERVGGQGRLDVEIVDELRFVLRVDPLYRLMAAMVSSGTAGHGLPPDSLAQIREAVRRAAMFIARVEDRNRTIRAVAEHVVETQRAFILDGPEGLRPLTRAQAAEAVGVHESTVSRATAGRHVMLPSGKVVPFRVFFNASLGAQDALRRIVADEDRALSDRELSERLRDLGHHVARRTVAKYRMNLGILPHSIRAADRAAACPGGALTSHVSSLG